MFNKHITRVTIGHLIGKDLLINGPLDRFTYLIAEISNPLNTCITSVVGVDDANEVIFGQCLEVVKEVLDWLVEGIPFDRAGSKQARQAVDDDQPEVNWERPSLHLLGDHWEDDEKFLEVKYLDNSQAWQRWLNSLCFLSRLCLCDEILHRKHFVRKIHMHTYTQNKAHVLLVQIICGIDVDHSSFLLK